MEIDIERQMVEQVLKKIKIAAKIKFTIAKNRPENLDTILELEYTDSLIEDTILSLSVNDCISSFKQDKGGYQGFVYEFGRTIKSREVYIKFRILFENDICHISCISFHFANYVIKYRFK